MGAEGDGVRERAECDVKAHLQKLENFEAKTCVRLPSGLIALHTTKRARESERESSALSDSGTNDSLTKIPSRD